MAIPDDPYFSQSELMRLNSAFRLLGLSKSAQTQIASYIDDPSIKQPQVQAWLAPRTGAGLAGPPWADDYSRAEMLAILARLSREELRAAGNKRGFRFLVRATRAEMVAALTKKKNKFEVGAILDDLRPRQAAQQDALPEDIYFMSYLSWFWRGTIARRRADVVLALLGEVKQNPEGGGNSVIFLQAGYDTIDDAEEGIIWPLRFGSYKGASGMYLREAWHRITLTKEPRRWLVTVEAYTDTSDPDQGVFRDTGTGWPTRDTWQDKEEEFQFWMLNKEKREQAKAAKKKAARERTKARKKGRK
jgi:hypothetical protein